MTTVLLAACCLGLEATIWSDEYIHRSFAVVTSGDYAFVASSEKGAMIMDMRNVFAPKVVGVCRTRGRAYDLELKGNYLYVAGETLPLEVCDVSDKANPKVVGIFECPLIHAACSVEHLSLVGSSVYLGNRYVEEVYTIDVTDPTKPTLVSTYKASGRVAKVAVKSSLITSPKGIVIKPTLLLVATGTTGVDIVDLANPAAPVRLTRYLNNVISVYTVGDTMYLGTYGTDSLRVVNIANPTSPTLIKKVNLDFFPRDMVLKGTTLYAVGSDGIVAVNVSPVTIGNPILKTYASKTYGMGIAILRDDVVVGAFSAVPVLVVNMGPTSPNLLGSYGKNGEARVAHVEGRHIAVADIERREVHLYDRETLKLQYVFTNDGVLLHTVLVHADHLYIGTSTNLIILRITDPEHPFEVSRSVTGNIYTLHAERLILYVTGFTRVLDIYEISNPGSIKKLGTYALPHYAFDLKIAGNTCYACSMDGMVVIDVSNPTAPTLISDTFLAGDPLGIDVAGDMAYVASRDGGLQILDISNPAKPYPRGFYKLVSARSVSVADGKAYVADYVEGLFIFDVSDPDTPLLLGRIEVDGRASDVEVLDGTVYMADYGLRVLQVTFSTPAPPTPVPTVEPTPLPTVEPTPVSPVPSTPAPPTTPAPTSVPTTPSSEDSDSDGDSALESVPFYVWVIIAGVVGICIGAVTVYCACKPSGKKNEPYA